MEFITKLSHTIQNLTKKEFERNLAIALGIVALMMGGIIYLVRTHSLTLVSNIKQLERLANEATGLRSKFEKFQLEEERIQEILDENKDFDLKVDFEQFCKTHNVTPELGWQTMRDKINDEFDEISLTATFKEQSTQILTTLLQAIEKREIIYIKGLSIRIDKEKGLEFDLTLATKQRKTKGEA